jgi:hypothetical protein
MLGQANRQVNEIWVIAGLKKRSTDSTLDDGIAGVFCFFSAASLIQMGAPSRAADE